MCDATAPHRRGDRMSERSSLPGLTRQSITLRAMTHVRVEPAHDECQLRAMRRRDFITLLGGAGVAATAWPRSLRAQEPVRVRRIGFLGNSTAALEANLVEPFREGLRDLGYVEGRNVVIEYRWAEGKYERLPALIA